MVSAPTEQTMGNVQRIFYYHVPSAWTAFLLFSINFLASVYYLVRNNQFADRMVNLVVIFVTAVCCVVPFVVKPLPLGVEPGAVASTGIGVAILYFGIRKYFGDRADVLALVSAEVGVVFCTVVLVDRSVVGAAGVGNLVDLGHAPNLDLAIVADLRELSHAAAIFEQQPDADACRGALAVFGALDVPLVYFSIWYFRTQHPQPVIGGGGSIDPRMLHVLLLNWLAFLCFAFLVCWSRYRLEVLSREVEETQALESLLEPRGAR